MRPKIWNLNTNRVNFEPVTDEDRPGLRKIQKLVANLAWEFGNKIPDLKSIAGYMLISGHDRWYGNGNVEMNIVRDGDNIYVVIYDPEDVTTESIVLVFQKPQKWGDAVCIEAHSAEGRPDTLEKLADTFLSEIGTLHKLRYVENRGWI